MRRESRKKPVLTSPWKIGMLVALLLVVTCIGTGYYMVRVYDMELRWLSFGDGRWHIDSFMFFSEMYILAAAVLVISLASYFLVVSAVRRYKFYLDSGQDYRKMISLADSIDDLTNPAQIARLADYSELQNVLRNYGDQIREVSQELEQRGQEHRSVDLEMEIESLLSGEPVQEGLTEGKWWSPLFKKLEKYTKDNQEIVADIEERVEQIRRIFCNVMLSNGRVLEAAGGAGEDIVEIMRAIGELNGIAGELDVQAADAVSSSGPGNDWFASTVDRMENSLRRLEQSGRVLDEFSEENNGLALSIALMAAKGGAGDKDLAQFAEKARTTAERFKKLGVDITAITADIAGCCRVVRRGESSNETRGGAVDPELQAALSNISLRIEHHSKSLQQKITSLKNELEGINELLQQGLSKLEISESAHQSAGDEGEGDRSEYKGDASIVNFGVETDDESDDEADIVIDHGKLWEDGSFGHDEPEAPDRERDDPATESSAGIVEDVETPFADDAAHDDVIEDDECGREISNETEAEDATGEGNDEVFPDEITKSADTAMGGDWNALPGHNWLKVDIEKSVPERIVDVEVREDRIVSDTGIQAEERWTEDKVTMEIEDSPEAGDTGMHADDGELVYDLFELGAVEYVEETKRH